MIDVILGQLIGNTEYFSKVWPYMDEEYFPSGPPKILFKSMKKHVDTFNVAPTLVAMEVAVDSTTGITENEHKGAIDLLKQLKIEKESTDWTVPKTEEYIKSAAIEIATSKIIEIQMNNMKEPEKRDKRVPDVGAIPEIMQKALAVSFDSHVGHDWLNDFESRWLAYQSKARKIPFKMKMFNVITKGGVETGTLNIFLAGTNVGKSLGLCTLAADYIQLGKNVLYISMEMAEEICAKRIDANLLDISLDDIDDGHVSYAEYKAKMNKWRDNTQLGRLIIKQYPTGGANANTFRALLNELKLKKNFKPDIVIVDYLGICASCRIRFTENTYTLVKAIAEELRALAVDYECAVWSAAQTTRAGWDNSDISMGDVAESAGLVHTVDFMAAIMETDEIKAQGRMLIKQLKSRYGDKDNWNKFVVGVRKGFQRWFDVEQPQAQSNASGVQMQGGHGIIQPGANDSTRAKIEGLANILNEPGGTIDIEKMKSIKF